MVMFVAAVLTLMLMVMAVGSLGVTMLMRMHVSMLVAEVAPLLWTESLSS
jgi:hypothetical protein